MTASLEFRFCPSCATPLGTSLVGDRQRSVCPRCGWVHYRNPAVGTAVILIEKEHLLIGQRRAGGWCIPCGYVEWDESVEAAAVREFREETGLQVDLQGVFAVKSNFHDPQRHTVGIWFWGRRNRGTLKAGSDLQAVEFVPLNHLPPLTFPTDRDVVSQIMETKGRLPATYSQWTRP